MKRPRIYFAFANDHSQYLQSLNEERKAIRSSLNALEESGFLRMQIEASATLEDVFEYINKHDDLTVFHYSGHAGVNSLFLETPSGKTEKANSGGIAELLGTLPSLKLVVLNGCATKDQVEFLLEKGVPAVIATYSAVEDKKAFEFAAQFYSALGKHKNVGESFEIASAYIKSKHDQDIPILRGLNLLREEVPSNPWGLFIGDNNNDVLVWSIPKRVYPKMLTSIVVSVVILLIALSLVFNLFSSLFSKPSELLLQIMPFREVSIHHPIRSDDLIQMVKQRLSYTPIQVMTPELVSMASDELNKAALINVQLPFSLDGGLISKATHVLSGRIESNDSLTTVVAELRHKKTNRAIWLHQYAVRNDDPNIWNVPSEIARSLCDHLNFHLNHFDSLRVITRFTRDYEAQIRYNEALQAWSRRDSQGYAKAISSLKYAIAQDTSFSEAYGLLSLVYVTAGSRVGIGIPKDTAMIEGLRYADSALNKNRHCVNALIALGGYYQDYKNDYLQAYAYLKRAIDLAPTDAIALQANAEMYLKIGKPDSALILINHAHSQMLGDRTIMWLRAKVFIANGLIDKGFELADDVARLDSLDGKNSSYHRWEYYNAKHQFDKALSSIPLDKANRFLFEGFTFLEALDFASYDSLRVAVPDFFNSDEMKMYYLARSGNMAEAVKLLDKIMHTSGSLTFIWFIQTFPFEVFNELRSDPDAASIMAKYGITFLPHPYLS